MAVVELRRCLILESTLGQVYRYFKDALAATLKNIIQRI